MNKESVRVYAKIIKKKLKDNMLCGKLIDMGNIDEIIVAAYSLGESEYREKVDNAFKKIYQPRRKKGW